MRPSENRKYTITSFIYEITIQIEHQKYFYVRHLRSLVTKQKMIERGESGNERLQRNGTYDIVISYC